MKLNFDDLETAYKHKSNNDLKFAYFLFNLMRISWLTKIGTFFTELALKLRIPFIETLIYKSIFWQFVGGRTLEECQKTVDKLWAFNVATILDVGIEGMHSEEDYNRVVKESIAAINFAKINESVPVITTKLTGLASENMLERISNGTISKNDEIELKKLENRMHKICSAAKSAGVGIFIDAEQSWIQDPIDELTLKMIKQYNKDYAVVYNTYQMYRHDKLIELKEDIIDAKSNGYILGAKLVRGAYLEQENERASELGIQSIVHTSKQKCDDDYNAGIQFCLQNIDNVSICNASHNQKSIELQIEFMLNNNIAKNHKHLNFCQLYGMGDFLSYNLTKEGYNGAKYVPYGKIRDVFPYLARRAEENSSMTGEVTRELGMIKNEMKRRKIN